jgi:predicted RNase H-like nuclease
VSLRQSWGLRDRILEDEFFVSESSNTIEAHPEVCFRAMRGKPLAYSKKTRNGRVECRRRIAGAGIDLPDNFPDAAGNVPPDNLLDTAAAAWTAWRGSQGQARLLPESAGHCTTGHRQVIWFKNQLRASCRQ